MLEFNFLKISQLSKSFFKKRKDISQYLKKIQEIWNKKNYNFPEGFLSLTQEALFFSRRRKEKILLIGIGGSSLGAQAIYYSLKNKKKLNEIVFLNSLNPLYLKKFFLSKKKEKITICFISESGKTLETIANFFVLFKKIKKYNPRIFVVTDKDSPLNKFALKNKWQTFFLPKAVVGRYSVFSNSGLVPLYLAGIDVKGLLKGAEEANKFCLIDDPLKNPAYASALIIFYQWQKGKNIYTNFIFPPDLEFFGRWYCQLMAESLGKKGRGITPAFALGTTDFHSLAQLYLDGPRDKLINFVFVKNLGIDFFIPEIKDFKKELPELEKKRIWQINKAIFDGMKKVFLKKKIPFTETILENLNERELGQLFEMKMIEIILLAKLMKVNAFNQPAVELYKKETRKLLSNN